MPSIKSNLKDYFSTKAEVYSDEEMLKFHETISNYTRQFKDRDGNLKTMIDIKKFLTSHIFTDKNGRKFTVMKRITRNLNGIEFEEDMMNFGKFCEGYNEGSGGIESVGNQPVNIILEKVRQWNKWRGRMGNTIQFNEQSTNNTASQAPVLS